MTVEHGYTHRKDDVLKRLRRIEGQTRGLQRMVDEDTYCIDVLTQVAAVTTPLPAVSLTRLADHMTPGGVTAARAGEAEGREKVTEAVDAITRLVRS